MKRKISKRLELSVETLRNLNALELARAVGGLPYTETCNCPTFSCQSKPVTECFCV